MLQRLASSAVRAPRVLARLAARALSATARPEELPTSNLHRSNAQELVSAVGVIEVDGHVAMCDGGAFRARRLGLVRAHVCSPRSRTRRRRPRAHPPSPQDSAPPECAGGGATGHPIEFIQLDKRAGVAPATCKYCGLRYKMAHHH